MRSCVVSNAWRFYVIPFMLCLFDHRLCVICESCHHVSWCFPFSAMSPFLTPHVLQVELEQSVNLPAEEQASEESKYPDAEQGDESANEEEENGNQAEQEHDAEDEEDHMKEEGVKEEEKDCMKEEHSDKEQEQPTEQVGHYLLSSAYCNA